jgi:hypothetical protein
MRRPGSEASTPGAQRFDVAYPIQVNGKVHSIVALDIAPRPEPELQAVLRQLQWGAGWLELLVYRSGPRRAADNVDASKERLQIVLDLVTSALGHERFYGALTAFATTVATRLACDRVSVGFIKGGRARVRAVSHSAQFGKQTNLVRAIGAAMDESLDQRATVVYPIDPGRRRGSSGRMRGSRAWPTPAQSARSRWPKAAASWAR